MNEPDLRDVEAARRGLPPLEQPLLPVLPDPTTGPRCVAGGNRWLGWDNTVWFTEPSDPRRPGQAEVCALLGPEQYHALVTGNACKVNGSDGNEFTLTRRDMPEPRVTDSRNHLLCVYLRPETDVAWEDAWLGILRWIRHDETRFREKAFDQGPAQELGARRIYADRPVLIGQQGEIAPLIISSLVPSEFVQTRAPEIVGTSIRAATEQWTEDNRGIRFTTRTLNPQDFEGGPYGGGGCRDWRFTIPSLGFVAPHRIEILHNVSVPDRCAVLIHSITVDPRDTIKFSEMVVQVGASRCLHIGISQLYIPTDVIIGADTQYRFQPTGFLENPILALQRHLVNIELRRQQERPIGEFTFILNGIIVEPYGRGLA